MQIVSIGTICMQCQIRFSVKNEKSISLTFGELTLRVVKVKQKISKTSQTCEKGTSKSRANRVPADPKGNQQRLWWDPLLFADIVAETFLPSFRKKEKQDKKLKTACQ